MSSLKVYIVNTLDSSFTENREALAHSLSDYRMEKYHKLEAAARKSSEERITVKSNNMDLCLAAGLVTDIGLQAYGLREKDMKYGVTGRGKPVFLNYPELRFNVSHSGHYAVAAFSEEFDPGIDIERCSRISNRIIYNFFSEGERQMILSQPDEISRKLMFGRIWTVREAFMKATGLGMATPRDAYETVMKEGRLAISQHVCEGEFGTYEMTPIDDYCISVVAGRNISSGVQARG